MIEMGQMKSNVSCSVSFHPLQQTYLLGLIFWKVLIMYMFILLLGNLVGTLPITAIALLSAPGKWCEQSCVRCSFSKKQRKKSSPFFGEKCDKNEIKTQVIYFYDCYRALRITPQEISRRHRELRLTSRGGEQKSLGSQLATWRLRPEH